MKINYYAPKGFKPEKDPPRWWEKMSSFRETVSVITMFLSLGGLILFFYGGLFGPAAICLVLFILAAA